MDDLDVTRMPCGKSVLGCMAHGGDEAFQHILLSGQEGLWRQGVQFKSCSSDKKKLTYRRSKQKKETPVELCA